MTKQSLNAYREIYTALKGERAKLYAYVFHSKEVTISQYANFCGKGKNSVSGRFSELHKAGLLEITGKLGKESVYEVSQRDTYSPIEFEKFQIIERMNKIKKELVSLNKKLEGLC